MFKSREKNMNNIYQGLWELYFRKRNKKIAKHNQFKRKMHISYREISFISKYKLRFIL
jgi:hypothetical protein